MIKAKPKVKNIEYTLFVFCKMFLTETLKDMMIGISPEFDIIPSNWLDTINKITTPNYFYVNILPPSFWMYDWNRGSFMINWKSKV